MFGGETVLYFVSERFRSIYVCGFCVNCKFYTLDVNNITKTNDERMFAEMFFTDSAVKVMKEVCVVLTATCIDWFLFCLHFTFF